MRRIVKYLDKRSRAFQISTGLILLLFLGAIDYLTGREISFSLFYLIPISLIAWSAGRIGGIVMSVSAALIWLLADMLWAHSYPHSAIPFWNALMRLGFFLVVTYMLTGLKSSRERQDELGQFIIHDLRSPLSNVMNGLYMLRESEKTKTDTTQLELIEMSLISCNRMLTLINSLLDLARLETGYLQLHLSKIKVKSLIDSSLKQVEVLARRSNVGLQSEPDSNFDEVLADPDLTTRILVNLLSNAVKFSHNGSMVTVGTGAYDSSSLRFYVTDQGEGISPEWVGKVFDKFTQAESRKAGGVVGSGLGLTFSRLAVEAQGGRIWLESKLGHGTTISFTLPLNAKIT